MHHVTVGDDVLFAFETHFTGFLGTDLAAGADVVLVAYGLGADEALLEIRVNDARRLRRLGALRDGPGSRFLRTDGEIGHKMQKRVTGANETVQPGLLEA